MTRRAPRRETPSPAPTPPTPLAGAIQRRRVERHLTLEELARLADTSDTNVSNWEKGARPRDRDLILALDDALEAGGEIVQLYDAAAGPAELARRVAALEARMTDIEQARDSAMPEIRQNTEDLAKLFDRVSQLAGEVQRLIDRKRRTHEAPPGSG